MTSYEKTKKLSRLLNERNYWLGVELDDFERELDLERLAGELDTRLRNLDPGMLPTDLIVSLADGDSISVSVMCERGPNTKGTPEPIGCWVFPAVWRV